MEEQIKNSVGIILGNSMTFVFSPGEDDGTRGFDRTAESAKPGERFISLRVSRYAFVCRLFLSLLLAY